MEVDHLVTQPFADRDEDFLRLVALLVFDRVQLLEACQTRLRLGLACLGVLPHPLQLLLHRLDAAGFLLGFGLKSRLFLLQPAGVVALPRNAMAAVELENPLGGVVEEVAVVRHRHHGPRVAHQELLQPVDRLGVEVVGRLVEQQHVGVGQQQLAQRDAALLAARQVADHRVPRRQSQGIGRDFHLRVEISAGGGEDRLAFRLLLGQLVEVGVGLGIGGVDFIQPGFGRHDLAQPGFHCLAHGVRRIELRLLRQVADADARHRDRFAFDVLVHSRHDADERGLAGAVETQQADLGSREKAQGNVFQNLPLGRNDLADSVEGIHVLRHE